MVFLNFLVSLYFSFIFSSIEISNIEVSVTEGLSASHLTPSINTISPPLNNNNIKSSAKKQKNDLSSNVSNSNDNNLDICELKRKNPTPSSNNTVDNDLKLINNNSILDDSILKNLEMNSNKQTNLYNRSDKGPFVVFISKDEINLIKLGQALKINKIQNIDNVTKINKNLVKVVFKKFEDANKCVNSKLLKEADRYNPYIPNIFTTSIGVVRGVPLDLSIDEIKSNLKSSIPYSNIERLTKWNIKEKSNEDIDIIKITFNSSCIPYNVTLYESILIKVNYFIPSPLFCKKCLNYGHTFKRCTSKINRCATCAKIFIENHECDKKDNCKFCGFGHITNYFKCNERYRQKQIRELMVMNKVSFREARDTLFGVRNRLPKPIDFSNDITKENKSMHNNNANLGHTDNSKIIILNDLVSTLKEQLKAKENKCKKIENFLSSDLEPINDIVKFDSFRIKLTELIKN